VLPTIGLLSALLGAGDALAQVEPPGSVHVMSLTSPDGRTSRQTIAPGTVLVQSLSADGPIAARSVTPGAPQGFIVQFSAPPIERARRLGLDFEVCRAPYERFMQAIPALKARMAALRPAGDREVVVGLRFETVFNGVAITGPPELAASLRELPDVIGVFLDDTVRTAVEPEAAPSAVAGSWSADAAGGEGIEVAIIDTGIDYTHPDLGGCFGPGCRVVAGWDFVNNDADPRDDHGHGTHVAGIVGASGSMMGVAPGVRFHAYKVITAIGWGLESWIIAGIERAVDPDRNPDTHDPVDVINLSVGGPGNADSPASQAVDEAVATGVVCVVAAGNEGTFFSVASPGAARRALTVGASDQGGNVAAFSSRGPAPADWAIKPDVVAPGVAISSTWPGGGYMILSGTSMATPFVAGSAALLKQAHPDWTPDEIKAALMTTAAPVGATPYEGGAGLIREANAAALDLFIEPASLSFERMPPGPMARTSQRSVRLVNHSAVARTVHLSVEGSLPAGVRLTIDPADPLVGAGQEVSVLVTLSIDPTLTVPEAEPFAYWGRIVADDGTTEQHVPFGFTKAAEVFIDFDRPDGLVALHDRSGHRHLTGWRSWWLVRPGTFDVIALVAGERWIVREGLTVTDHRQVTIGQDEAIFTMQHRDVDETGAVRSGFGLDVLYHRASGYAIVVILETRDRILFSPVSDAYSWEWVHYIVWPPKKTYTWHAYRRGITEGGTFQNAPEDLRHVVSTFRVPPGKERVRPLHFVGNGPRGMPVGGWWLFISLVDMRDPPLVVPFTLDSYFMAAPDDEFQFGTWYKRLEEFDVPDVVLDTPYIRAETGQPTNAYVLGGLEEPVHTLPGDRLRAGFGPPVWFGRFDNDPDTLRIRPSLGKTSWIFPLQGGAWAWPGYLRYTLARDGIPLESNLLSEMGGLRGDSLAYRVITPGPHTFAISDERYWIDGEPGVARATASFDSRAADRNPPYLTELSILANGALSDTAGARSSNEVQIGVRDDTGLAAVRLYHRVDANTPWIEMVTASDGGRLRSRLPDSTGYLSLKIEAVDLGGNRLEYTVEPAVHLKSAIPIAQLAGSADLEGTRVHLTWRVPQELFDGNGEVFRSDDGESWSSLGTPAYGSGAFSFDDEDIAPGHAYAYRLTLTKDGLERITPTTWVTVPANVLAFSGPVRNPSVGGPTVRFVLPDSRPANIEVIDIAGRRLVSVPVGPLGPGQHQLDLSGSLSWRPGIYLLRLRHPEREITRKVCVLL